MPVAYTSALSVQVLDFKDIGLLIQRGRLYALPVRRASALPAASFRFHLAMDTLAVRLTLPPVGCVKDFEEFSSSPSCRCALLGAPIKKPSILFSTRALEYNLAATYSPTQSPMQYHRRIRA